MESRSAAEYLGGEYLGPLTGRENARRRKKGADTQYFSPLPLSGR